MKAKLSIVAISMLVLQSSWTSPKMIKSSFVETKLSVSKTSLPPEFSFFRTHRQGRFGITSTWGLTSENGVQMYYLEKSDQYPFDEYSTWQPICVLQCTNARSYKFTDENVFPGYIGYRVRAVMASGEMVSPISIVHIISH